VIGYGLLGKDAPAYVAVPAIPITKDNILQAYSDSYHAAPPPEVTKALGK
jgi:ribose transport system substrate-binding protein